MCRKIRCDEKFYKVLSFWVYLNKALVAAGFILPAAVRFSSLFGTLVAKVLSYNQLNAAS